jgi:hypothetical protein
MLLPNKHITLAQSIIGLGSFALGALEKPKTVDTLWNEFQEVNNTARFPAYHTFENMMLAIDFLFTIGVIAEDQNGKIIKCDS